MLTKEQIKSTKESASADAKRWFNGHQSQTKLIFKPNPEAEQKGFNMVEGDYIGNNGVPALDENGRQYRGIGERVPMPLAEYFAECLGQTIRYKDRAIAQFGYTEDTWNEKIEMYNESFWKCHALRQKNTDKHDKVLAKYKDIFDEAEKIAAAVDVSDIKDGFPCGSVHLYLEPEMQDTDLGKALAFKNGDSSTDAYKYKLPISYQNSHQCISFDERICAKVKEFLDEKGVKVKAYSWID